MSDFVSSVNKTLSKYCQMKLKKFKLHTCCDIRYESQVNKWVRYAINRDVEELNLGFRNSESMGEAMLDQFFFTGSCFTDLTLSGCKLNPSGAISWKNLRSLCIFNGVLDENLIKNILSGRPLLETLELHWCYGYRRLDITSKSVKKVVLDGCTNPYSFCGGHMIEINAPNISSLHEVILWKVLLQNVYSLVEANLDYTYEEHWGTAREKAEEEILKGLILSLRHVKELKIGGSYSKVLSRLEAKGSVFPSNLKVPIVIHDSV